MQRTKPSAAEQHEIKKNERERRGQRDRESKRRDERRESKRRVEREIEDIYR